MQLEKLDCPKCKKQIEIDIEGKSVGDDFDCPLCKSSLKITKLPSWHIKISTTHTKPQSNAFGDLSNTFPFNLL